MREKMKLNRIKLDIGGGEREDDGWVRMDINTLTDVIHNLNNFPTRSKTILYLR
jgi:hypothetical protein